MFHFNEVQRKRAQNKKFEWHPRVQKQLADVLAKLEEEEGADSRSVKEVDGFLTIPQIIKNINPKKS